MIHDGKVMIQGTARGHQPEDVRRVYLGDQFRI